MIYRKQEYVQDEPEDREFPIKQVDMLESLDGSAKRFLGRAALNIQTPAGVQQLPVSFEIEADSVEEAFEKYVETARPQLEEVKDHIRQRMEQLRQAEQSRIVTPGEAGASGIIDLDQFQGSE